MELRHIASATVDVLREYGLLAPVVQLLLATLLGFFLAERWQRWRQRREFQHRAMMTFSEVSLDVFDRLSTILTRRVGRRKDETHHKLYAEAMTRRVPLQALAEQVYTLYDKHAVIKHHFDELLKAGGALTRLTEADVGVAESEYQPVRVRFFRERKLVMIHMFASMGLIRRAYVGPMVREIERAYETTLNPV